MSELDKLQAALRAATPAPDAEAKAAALRAATENFTRIQETAPAPRPTPQVPQKRGHFWKGLTDMFDRSPLRPALYATTCLIVVGAAYVTFQPETPVKDVLQNASPSVISQSRTEPETVMVEEAVTRGNAPSPARKKQESQLSGTAQLAAPSTDADTAISRSSKKLSAREQADTFARPAPSPVAGIVAMSEPDIITPEPAPNNDQFAGQPENPLKITSQDPVSTFSIDVDTASYAYVRSALLNGQPINPDAVRVEEMINYFPYDYAAPDLAEAPFSTQVTVSQTPWNPDTKLVQIGIQGAKPATENRPPLNLVFLIDTSGSMRSADKLGLLKQSFRLMLGELRPSDQVAIVTYAGSAGTVLEPTAAANSAKILESLNALQAGGSTAGQAGLRQAYALADQMREDSEVSRVLLATDGDFNVGINNPDEMKTFIETKRDSGTYLSVLGFGRGNYRDDMMQTLAQNGNGTASYIDTLAEAQKVLVDQLSGALFPIANDVKVQVEFNPAQIAEYRLIGYETRTLKREDFNNDKVDAGEIGAGHQVTALYEITPVGSPAILNDRLRYAAQNATTQSGELGFIKLRYKSPGATQSQLITTPIVRSAERDPSAGFAAAIAGFGQLLKGSAYTKNWSYPDAIALATQTKGADPFGYRAEAIRLMKLAASQQ